MRIERVKIKGFGPFRAAKPYETTFVRENCLVGMNGGGKTTLLRAMAGVAGTDEATMLVSGQEVEYFYLRLKQGNTTYTFEARGRFDGEEITRFKATLPERVSFALTEWDVQFPSKSVDPQFARDQFQRYVANHSGRDHRLCYYSPQRRSVELLCGDGFQRALHLLLLDTPKGVPLILDNPGHHLDIQAKRTMINLLTDNDRQLIYTTHCPEMMLHDGWKGYNKQQKNIEVSDKKVRTKQKSS